MYRVRVDEQYATREQFLAFCGDHNVFAVRETVDGANPHYQAFLATPVKMQALRKRAQKAMPDARGNRAISISACADRERYLRYLCKGTKDTQPEVIHRHGLEYSLEWVEAGHKAFWEENASNAAKKSETTCLGYLVEQAKLHQFTSYEQYVRAYIARAKANNKAVSIHAARAVCNTAACQTLAGFEDALVQDICGTQSGLHQAPRLFSHASVQP